MLRMRSFTLHLCIAPSQQKIGKSFWSRSDCSNHFFWSRATEDSNQVPWASVTVPNANVFRGILKQIVRRLFASECPPERTIFLSPRSSLSSHFPLLHFIICVTKCNKWGKYFYVHAVLFLPHALCCIWERLRSSSRVLLFPPVSSALFTPFLMATKAWKPLRRTHYSSTLYPFLLVTSYNTVFRQIDVHCSSWFHLCVNGQLHSIEKSKLILCLFTIRRLLTLFAVGSSCTKQKHTRHLSHIEMDRMCVPMWRFGFLFAQPLNR